MNRTIEDRAKCLMFDAGLDKSYWAEAANMAVYLINRSVCSAHPKKTPEEIWTGNKVDLGQLQLFGTEVMVHIPKQNRRKWDRKSSKLIFVGLDNDRKGYRCIDSCSKKLIVSRDVIFLEKVIETNEQPIEEFVSVREIDDDCDGRPNVDEVPTNEEETTNDAADQSVVVISDSSSSDDTILNDETFEDDTFEDDTFEDPNYEPNESEFNESSMFVRQKQLDRYIRTAKVQIVDSEPSTVQEALSCNDAFWKDKTVLNKRIESPWETWRMLFSINDLYFTCVG